MAKKITPKSPPKPLTEADIDKIAIPILNRELLKWLKAKNG
jgi:hypothetical protein